MASCGQIRDWKKEAAEESQAWAAQAAVLSQATLELVPTQGTTPGSDDTHFAPSTSGYPCTHKNTHSPQLRDCSC
ncbi:hypothetical protein Celaphus_00002047 [Cervus elaphus hippelaphus]|uniref:Uncharacterized protein n=1 Tax=Cervus elaphus hippelaphus TaxID=46360 RepID=A0A212CEY4_CEREH|nr:hypothetical protein Celaphus_00002047 [Cervus elaphus hippelaphus]